MIARLSAWLRRDAPSEPVGRGGRHRRRRVERVPSGRHRLDAETQVLPVVYEAGGES